MLARVCADAERTYGRLESDILYVRAYKKYDPRGKGMSPPLTEIQKAERSAAIRQARRDYPHIDGTTMEMLWDYIHEIGPDEFQRRANSGHYDRTEAIEKKNMEVTE